MSFLKIGSTNSINVINQNGASISDISSTVIGAEGSVVVTATGTTDFAALNYSAPAFSDFIFHNVKILGQVAYLDQTETLNSLGAINFGTRSVGIVSIGATGDVYAYNSDAIAGGFLKINNAGTIKSDADLTSPVAIRASSLELVNSGSILSTVSVSGSANITNSGNMQQINIGAGSVTNTGTISSITSAAGASTFTYNGELGLITNQIGLDASQNIVTGGAGTERILVRSTVEADLGAGNDRATIVGSTFNANGFIDGGSGRDTIEASTTTRVGCIINLAEGTFTFDDDSDFVSFESFENAKGTSNDDALTGNAGTNFLNGSFGADVMAGLAGNDTYYVDDPGDLVLETASSGTDVVITSTNYTLGFSQSIEVLRFRSPQETTGLNLTGNNLAQSIIGNAGANQLNGLDGTDVLSGRAGNDTLNGGLGNDKMSGGAGQDIFVFNTALNATPNIDRITGFSGPDDTIRLENTGALLFNALTTTGTLATAAFRIGTAAADADDRIIYNSTNGALFYDADGTGAVAAIRFATMSNNPTLAAADFVVI
jgi:Ca2+-binding RTX toxin-like protein